MSHSNETKKDEQKREQEKLPEGNSSKYKKLPNRSYPWRRQDVTEEELADHLDPPWMKR